MPEVVVRLDGAGGIEGERSEQLHADDGVDEEEHSHEHADVGQRLERLYERVQENPDADAPPKELNQSGSAEQLKEVDRDHPRGVHDRSDHCDEVERVPGIFEVVLQGGQKIITSRYPSRQLLLQQNAQFCKCLSIYFHYDF